MTVQEHYDSLETVIDFLLKVGETPEEAEILAQRDYLALGGWVKARLKRYWRKQNKT